MTLLFTFNSAMPTLNEVIAKSKSHFARYAKDKKAYTDAIALLCRASGVKLEGRVYLHFAWHRKTARTDPDNIAFAKKYLLDGMVVGGMLKDDTAKQIAGFSDSFEFGHCDKVEVYLTEK